MCTCLYFNYPMPDLLHTLLKYDIGHLRIIAGAWGLELETSEVDSASEELCASFLDLEAVTETMEILPADARSALTALLDANSKIEWAIFSRKFGEIREMPDDIVIEKLACRKFV